MENATQNTTDKRTKGIGLIGLIGIVVSSCIGSGIFALPALLAKAAAPGVVLTAWSIVGVGFLALTLALVSLRQKCPSIDGIFLYAQEGFGNFAGFLCGWGYCLTMCTSVTGFAVMVTRVLCRLCPPLFGGLTTPNLLAILIASACIWILALLVIRGVESAAIFNACVMFVKVVSLLIFIGFCLLHFNINVFTTDFWGKLHPNIAGGSALASQNGASFNFGSIMQQIAGCLLPMTWIFGGIEGAVAISGRAAKKSDTKRATIIALGIVLILYVCTSILPFGIIHYAKLMAFPEPSTADVLKSIQPSWGETFISVAIGISVIGSMLSLTILPAETASMMGKHRLLSSAWSKTNKYNSPQRPLLVCATATQIMFIIFLFSKDAYLFAFSLCAINFLVTWTFALAFQVKRSLQNHEIGHAIIGGIALLFLFCGPLTVGWKFALLSCLGYAPGILLYLKVCQENNLPKFTRREAFCCALIVVMSVTVILLAITGVISIF